MTSMLAVYPRLSKQSRDAIAASVAAKRAKKEGQQETPVVNDILQANITAVTAEKPQQEVSLEEKELDAEIERMLSGTRLGDQQTAADPFSGLTPPSDERPRVWRGIWQRDKTPSPPPLSASRLEAIAVRTDTSKQKHVHRIQTVVEEERRRQSSPPRQLHTRGSRSRGNLHSPPATPSADNAGSFATSTSSRDIYVLERKAFGREPITNRASLLRYAGTPRSPSPTSSGMHRDRVFSSMPPGVAGRAADYYDKPKPCTHGIKHLAPKLAEYFESAQAESGDIWMARSLRTLSTPARVSGMWSPNSSFHGFRHRTPLVKEHNLAVITR